MDKFAYNYDKTYNEQLEKEIKLYKTLRLIFVIVGIIIAIGGIFGVISSISGFMKAGEEMVSSSTPDGGHEAFQSAVGKQMAMFGFGVLAMIGFALATLGPVLFTNKINNRTRVINEGKETDTYTIDEIEKRF